MFRGRRRTYTALISGATGAYSASMEDAAIASPAPSPRHPRWADVDHASWTDWQWQLRHRVTSLEGLSSLVELTDDERRGIVGRQGGFPMAVTPYYLSRFGGPRCPIRRQSVPLEAELRAEPWDLRDPLAEEEHSPVPILSHRYPDRALLYVSHTCPVYCRHCTRQRKVGDANSAPRPTEIDAAIDYLRRTPAVRDVLLSGGDPLSLSDERLSRIVAKVRSVASVEVIRLCTRNPVTLPFRITEELLARLRPFHPLYVSTHFNHPAECTPEAGAALNRLADAGFNCGNQMVLLAGINDDAATVERLNRWLVRHRCRPYYMFQCDLVAGTAHLRTPISKGLEILDALRGKLSGLAIPHFAVDLPGGGGKVTLVPERVERIDGNRWEFRDLRGRRFAYHEPPRPRLSILGQES